MNDKVELAFLISIISQLREVTRFLLDSFVEKKISEDALYSIRLFSLRLEELFEKLRLVREGISEDSLYPFRSLGSRLETLFEQLVKEVRPEWDKQGSFDKKINIALYREILIELHQLSEKELLTAVAHIILEIPMDREVQEIIETLKSFLQKIETFLFEND